MERNLEATPDPEVGFVDTVRADLDRAEDEGDEARLETLERVRGDLEAELDSSLENRTTGH
jgi:hypothetical protein